MEKEQHWKFEYEKPVADGVEIKCCYPRSKEKCEENKRICKERGWRVISCEKLYPFNTEKNQHNFDLIHNICMNTLYDMDSGEKKYDAKEYERLEILKEKSERFFCLPLPVAWLPWDEWKDAKELSEMAIIHRQNACIENGRYDLVKYC